MAVQYGYNTPIVQAPYGYQPALMQSYAPSPVVPMAPQPIVGRNAYMIQVDGEMAAKAWQCPPDMKPGDVIPLWDADGMHVYFKSLDGYGRLNPTKKARIVFEDDAQALPENTSGAAPRQEPAMDPNQFVSKAEFDGLKNDIAGIRQMLSGNRQNGRTASNVPQRGNGENT